MLEITVDNYDESDEVGENEERIVGVGDSAQLTPTHSHSPTPNASFAFLINPTICHLRDYISDYATCISVDILSFIVSQSYIPDKVNCSYY